VVRAPALTRETPSRAEGNSPSSTSARAWVGSVIVHDFSTSPGALFLHSSHSPAKVIGSRHSSAGHKCAMRALAFAAREDRERRPYRRNCLNSTAQLSSPSSKRQRGAQEAMSAAALIWEDNMTPGCTLIAYLHAKPEKRDELLKVLHSFVKPSRAEPACVDYHLHVSNDDPNLFVFYEN
jgi:hypothetical protein